MEAGIDKLAAFEGERQRFLTIRRQVALIQGMLPAALIVAALK
jgi:hypothetical protein